MRCFKSIEKAPIIGAFFVAFGLAIFLVACVDQQINENQKIDADRSIHQLIYVVDGDTVVIDEDTKVRLVGINTPEMGYGNSKREPFAKQAKNKLKALLGKGKIQLQYDKEKQDKRGRNLAHVFSASGNNVQIALLEQGLAFAVAVGDNQTYLSDYLLAELTARDKGIGVWSDDYFAPQKAGKLAREKTKGYKRVSGKVTQTSKSSKHITLHLGGQFRVLIPKQVWKAYFSGKPKQYMGKHIIARGWVFTSNDFSGVKIYHPSMIE